MKEEINNLEQKIAEQGVQVLAADKTPQTRGHLEQLAKVRNARTVAKSSIKCEPSDFDIDPEMPVVIASFPFGEDTNDLARDLHVEKGGIIPDIKTQISQIIPPIKTKLNPEVPIVILGNIKRDAVSRTIKELPNPVWFFGKKSNHDRLVPNLYMSEGNVALCYEGYRKKRKNSGVYNLFPDEFPTLQYYDRKNKQWVDTDFKQLYFQKEVQQRHELGSVQEALGAAPHEEGQEVDPLDLLPNIGPFPFRELPEGDVEPNNSQSAQHALGAGSQRAVSPGTSSLEALLGLTPESKAPSSPIGSEDWPAIMGEEAPFPSVGTGDIDFSGFSSPSMILDSQQQQRVPVSGAAASGRQDVQQTVSPVDGLAEQHGRRSPSGFRF